MARSSISNTVLEASQVSLANAIRISGVNTYTLGTNFLSWDSHNYIMSDIALSFGTRRTDTPLEVMGGSRESGFACGDSVISAFDFGLLYTVFTAMVMAKVEMGNSFPVTVGDTTASDIGVVWFGNDGVIYSVGRNLIIPFKNADVENACSHKKITVSNFCSGDVFQFDREGKQFAVTTQDGTILCMLPIPPCVISTYSQCFVNTLSSDETGRLAVGFDANSPLGQLIGVADSRTECMEALENYKKSTSLDSLVSRDDLVVVPEEHYKDLSNFYGSICYTDKQEIVVAVNYRRGLFVYTPWFPADAETAKDTGTDASANFQEFYNVTEGCKRIMRYASTVNRRPLTPAQFDLNMFMQVKEAFLDMKLSRIPIQASFGRIVVPESVLVEEVINDTGESMFCLVPIGVVGSKVICMSSEGAIISVNPSGWDLESAFYDITGVVSQ